MRSKTLQKKLMLNKRTVINLNGRAMNQVKAGFNDSLYVTCWSCVTCIASCPGVGCPTTTGGTYCEY
ncbi:MAG: class I lanthipeptide [Candidatus Aminicenantes bacterium]|jgi:heterodisulfide reductase subunit C